MRSTVLLLSLLSAACRSDKPTPDVDTGAIVDGAIDSDGDGYDVDEDCDDADDQINPGVVEICDNIDNNCDGQIDEGVTATFYQDSDSDGFGDSGEPFESCSEPSGYVGTGNDCDDSDGDTYPGAAERCDEIDNDCDGEVDEDVLFEWYADADGDGYGDLDSAYAVCDPPPGYVDNADDCDDTNAAALPGGEEVCDEADNDCNGLVDEGVTTTWYTDTDGDNFGVSDTTTEACDQPTGYASQPGDCDDTEVTVNPLATELCDTIDNDCDGATDEDDAADAATWYADTDTDGFGDSGTSTAACAAPSGYVSDDTDCDDTDVAINPDAAEVCDDVDNDCNGWVDDDDPAVSGTSTWHRDLDGDGYGDTLTSTDTCDMPSGYVADSTDCDDSESSTNPAAKEVCDEADNDCDGTTDEGVTTTFYADSDGDGHGDPSSTTEACEAPSGYVSTDADCDDTESTTSPNAFEVCDEVDNDCDGSIDNDAINEDTFYADADGDGFGDASDSAEDCEAPSGYVSDSDDCDDTDAAINPDATETCNEIDDNCDGVTDDTSDGGDTFYADTDGDGYGDPDSTTEACEEPSGYVSDDADCDDTNADINPDGTESCDEEDNDCNGTVDDDDMVLGDGEDCAAADCQDIYDNRPTASDDTYWIDPATSGTAFEVFCDQSNDGGGWTLVANIDDVSDPFFGGKQVTAWESTTTRNVSSIPTFDADVSVSTKYESWNTITVADVRIVYKNSGAVFLCEDLSYQDTLDAIFSDTPSKGDCSSLCTTWSEDLLSESSTDPAGLNCSDANEGWITSSTAENARIGAESSSHSCCVVNAFAGGMGDRGYSTSYLEKTWGAYSSGVVTDDNIMIFVR